jgi:hypothetical protein
MYDEYDERDGFESGPTILVNGSRQPLEVGANFMNAVKSYRTSGRFRQVQGVSEWTGSTSFNRTG